MHEVNRLLKQYLEMKKMMTQMNDPRFMKRMQAMAGKGGGMPGMPNFPGGSLPLAQVAGLLTAPPLGRIVPGSISAWEVGRLALN